MSKSQPAFAGMDVSARTLNIALARPGHALKEMTFDNTPQAHKRLLKALTKGGRHVRVCLEATGLYSLQVALALHHHPPHARHGRQSQGDEQLRACAHATRQDG